MTEARVLVVHCPDWPVVAADAWEGAPAAVIQANQVLACSPGARREGVVEGLRRREAQGRCPDLELIAHDPARDARRFEPVAAAVEAITPGVEILQPGTCAFQARGAARYHGGERALTGMIRDAVTGALRGAGECRIGVADGVFTAMLAAREDRAVSPGASRGFLAALPVGVLDLPELCDLLVRLGLRTLGELAALPSDAVADRFGPAGERAHRLANGVELRPLVPRLPPPDLVAQVELEPPADRVDVAAFAAKTIADDLAERLTVRGLACRCVRIEAESEHSERLARRWRHPDAFTAVTLTERVRWQLEGWLAADAEHRPSGGISLLRLSPEELVADHGRQLGFWGEATEADDRAARAAARVQGLLGQEAVQVVARRGGRSPVEQVTTRPALGEHGSGPPPDPSERRPRTNSPAPLGSAPPVREDPTAPWPGRLPPPSPATVPAARLPAEVLDAEGAVVEVSGRGSLSAPPYRLWVGRGPWATIAAWAGPWPIDERWWDPAAHHRYVRMQVRTEEGTALLLEREAGSWWLGGSYD